MNDTSFSDLLKENNYERIFIDPRLESSFRRVMNKIQIYFNANGYTDQRDYSKFFEEYLLSDNNDKLQFLANNNPSKKGLVGYYCNYKPYMICIDESLFNEPTDCLDATLCHEFIHFLVMRELKNRMSDDEIGKGGFINEALTEMLTQQIYPNDIAYKPQVQMMKFANLLTNNVNNYSRFLRGYVDSKGGASSWNNFVSYVSKYQNDMKDKHYYLEEAIKDSSYISAQRFIIQTNISPNLVKTFDDYINKLDILQRRPVPDEEWINHFKNIMAQNLINNIGIYDNTIKKLLQKQINEYNEIVNRLKMYDGKDVVEVNIAGQTIAFDSNNKIYGARIYSAAWTPNTGIFKIQIGAETKIFNFNNLDFSKRKKDLLNQKNKISLYFSSTIRDDAKAVNNVSKDGNLLKIERFKLPIVGSKKFKNNYIYVATYKNRIEILDSAMQMGTMNEINAFKYIGMTSMENGLIYVSSLDKINSGIVFTKLSNKLLENKYINFLKQQINPNISSQDLSNIINSYKNSKEFNSDDELDLEVLKDSALEYYVKIQYRNMSLEDKKKLFTMVLDSNYKYLLSTKNGKINISILYNEKYFNAFVGECETLFDINGKGLWNDYYNVIKDNQMSIQESNEKNIIVPIDQHGNIIIDKERTSSKEQKIEEYIKQHEQSIKLIEKDNDSNNMEYSSKRI